MKNISIFKNYFLLPVLLVVGFISSCKKDDTGEVQGGKGAPTISRIRTVSRSVKDTVVSTYTTYTATGTTTTSQSTNVNHSTITPLDSTTTTGSLGNYYAIEGTNLASTTKILINGIQIYFNKALASDNTLVFNIPSTIPYVQPQANTIQVFNLYGSVTYNFTVLPPAPTISAVSNLNFSAGSQITLAGRGFSAVKGITLSKTTNALTIVSQNDSILVVKMPTTTVSRATLSFTYTSGTKTLNTGSTIEFVSIDNNYAVFANGAFQNSWADASWQAPSGASATAPSMSGKGSAVATYPAGGWKVEGWANYYPGLNYNASYTYLTFWVKGGKASHVLTLVGDQMDGGYGQNTSSTAYTVTVPANVWTYFKIPLGTTGTALNFWKNGTTAKQLGFFLKGVSGDVDETLYFDEVLFVK